MSRGRRLLLALSLAVSALIVAHTFIAADGWSRRSHARGDLTALEAGLERDQRRAAELRAQIDALRARTDVQEHVVRDELGYVRPGDLVVDVGAAPSR